MQCVKVELYNRFENETVIKYADNLTQGLAQAYILAHGLPNMGGIVKVFVDGIEHGHIGANCNIYLKNVPRSMYAPMGTAKYEIKPTGKLRKL